MALALKACVKCGGDLYWEEEDKEWVCFQGGHRLKEPGVLKVVEELKVKRKYTKGEKFFARYAKKDKAPVVKMSKGYWEGYRQAVLDMSPKR